MSSINVAVHGALGKMGQEVLRAVSGAPDMNPVGAADGMAEPGQISLPDGSGSVPISDNITDVLSGVDVVVDFSSADGAMCVIRAAAAYKVNVVVGSTGLSVSDYQEAEELANDHSVGIIIAPNFAMGAVIMIHLAKIASQFFDYADLTEMHHEAKIDAPSGTALAIAMAAVEGKGRRVYQRQGRKGADRRSARRRLPGCQRPQREDGGSGGPPPVGIRRARSDAHHPPRLHEPRELHARRNHGHPRSGQPQRTHRRPGEHHGTGISSRKGDNRAPARGTEVGDEQTR